MTTMDRWMCQVLGTRGSAAVSSCCWVEPCLICADAQNWRSLKQLALGHGLAELASSSQHKRPKSCDRNSRLGSTGLNAQTLRQWRTWCPSGPKSLQDVESLTVLSSKLHRPHVGLQMTTQLTVILRNRTMPEDVLS